MKKGSSLIYALGVMISGAVAAETSAPVVKPTIPTNEWTMIRQVAVNYSLTDEQTWLLAAIRRIENGRPGLEFGIGGPMNSGHRAHRYRDGVKSFYVQAAWAAGTIKKHPDEKPLVFAARYCPKNPERWHTSTTNIIARLKKENAGKLPGAKPAKKKLDFP